MKCVLTALLLVAVTVASNAQDKPRLDIMLGDTPFGR